MKWEDAKGNTFKASLTSKEVIALQRRQERFNAGAQSYNSLVAKAKELGIKGARVGMKRATLEQKIREHNKRG